mmetsp:Transcript_5836/g.10525  ORF Transcript_5836/g.10525 Transcript_5836/m.10525 type:complete len:146 (+) Transcript_5836:155-592(+)|eukprot:CAMPEP_0183735298 /NCGR_PEP_ID=MMETSP0737-20130205/46242_1 /TAXON_ID=385413 /ORGANISM="Thalassiosira miniscula, Strain CCMP1093" /LENGTH=145 /DNA_ID=CAMNT_0025968997 /DNA_START=162 /DNA_END=599 /DNA_ORIENTATION=-
MRVAEYMTTEAKAQVASPNATLGSIATQLVQNNCSCVVVVENKKPVGLLSKTDITRAFAEGVSSDTLAESFMSDAIVCVKKDTQTDDVADLIQKEFIHHIVVVDDNGDFAGIASSWDIAREVSLDAKAFPYNRELWTKTATPEMQ